MNDTVEVSRDVFEPLVMLVREGIFKNEKEALKFLVLDQAASKIHYFDLKISEMRAKYNMGFDEFKRRIESRIGEEIFEEWDDFIIWESYEASRSYWLKVESRLKSSTK